MSTLSADVRLRNTILNSTYPALPHSPPSAAMDRHPESLLATTYPMGASPQQSGPSTHLHPPQQHICVHLDPTLRRGHREKTGYVTLSSGICSHLRKSMGTVKGHVPHREREELHIRALFHLQRTWEAEGRRSISVQQSSFQSFLAKPKKLGQEQYLAKLPVSPCWKRGAASTHRLGSP